jgi:ATP-dependent RNA helicase DeaD
MSGSRARRVSGELEQKERTRALDAFRAGTVKVLVATDVAARGIDVPDVTRVLHVDPPDSVEAYTHRSGRTGRAGRKGTSILVMPPLARARTLRLLAGAGLKVEMRPAPMAADVEASLDAGLATRLRAPLPAIDGDDRASKLADALLADEADVPALVRRLCAHALATLPAPRPLTRIEPRPRDPSLRRPEGAAPEGPGRFAPRERGPRVNAPAGSWPRFRVTWGERHGADARRLLALLCRRGDIAGGDVGSIDIGPFASVVEVRPEVAAHFIAHASKPDERDGRVRVMSLGGPSGRHRDDGEAAAEERRPRPDGFRLACAPRRPTSSTTSCPRSLCGSGC